MEDELPFNKYLFFTAFTVNIATFSMGAATAWSSPAITRLNGLVDKSPLKTPITKAEEAALASLLLLGALFSAAVSRLSADQIGRKTTLLLSAIPNIFGFIFLTIATNTACFYVGRFLTGISVGVVFSLAPLYIREISNAKNRKILSRSLVLSISFGGFFVYAIAPFCKLHTVSMLNIFPPVIFVVLFGIWAPESPYYYVKKHKMFEAWTALKMVRCDNEPLVDEELVYIQRKVVQSLPDVITLHQFQQIKNHRKMLFIGSGLVILQQFTGFTTIFFHLESVIYKADIASLSIGTSTTIIAGIQVIAAFLASFHLNKFKRRLVLQISAFLMMITQLGSGICLNLHQYGRVVPLISLCFFVWEYTIGFGPFVATVWKEMFPPYVNSFATTLMICIFLSSALITTTAYPMLEELIGLGYIFIMFAIFCALAVVFVWFLVPETKEEEDVIREQNKETKNNDMYLYRTYPYYY